MKKIHVFGLSALVIVKIIIIVSIIYLAHSLIIIKYELKEELNQTRNEISKLNEQINLNQAQTQSQIMEISNNILSTKKDLTTQFNNLKASTSDFSGVIQETIPSVVSVATDISQGSGFVVDNQGYIVTNAHVLSGGRYAKVLTYESKNWERAQLIGYNLEMDVAVLKIDENIPALEFEDINNVNIGEKAIAIGNPLGLSFSVTEGIISSINRVGPNELPAYLQIDVPLNPGNSGGPLINKNGKVIGINNFKISGGENIGFALESNYANEAINGIFEIQNLTLRI